MARRCHLPDKRKHRGPDPRDAKLFGPAPLRLLRQAAEDLQEFFERGYSRDATITLVGNKYQLQKRQRTVLMRGAWGRTHSASRRDRTVRAEAALPSRVVVDGFNVVVATEALFSGGLLVRGTDGLLRDLSSVHGNYRTVHETRMAVQRLCEQLQGIEATWFLDRPVSNSGRLASLIREHGFDAECVDDCDAALGSSGLPVATSDGIVVDRGAGGVDLVGRLVEPQHWVVDLLG